MHFLGLNRVVYIFAGNSSIIYFYIKYTIYTVHLLDREFGNYHIWI